MFGLNVIRHRFFESNILLFQPDHPKHMKKAGTPGAIPNEGEYWCVGGHFGHKYEAAEAMGINWMHDRESIAQAIPPAYTRWIGEQFMRVVIFEQEATA
jgi:DNA (cytosine-5)-methyltransferase 1